MLGMWLSPMSPAADRYAPLSRAAEVPATGMGEGNRVRLLWFAALLWIAALLAVLALFALAGERSRPVVLILYAPRHVWMVPGLLLLAPALRRGRRALLLPVAAGLLVAIFPLMGFVFPRPAPRLSAPLFRVLSYNTTHVVDGVAGLRAVVLDARPDLVLLQWSSDLADEALSGPEFAGWTVRREAQFTVASRFPILSLETGGVPSGSGPPCAHATVDSPLGVLDVYDIRPQSAREELGAEHHRGLRQRLRGLIANVRAGGTSSLESFREAQVRSIAQMVAGARHPVLIAGDTNLPAGSLLLKRYFGDYDDAFVKAGWGFGFTHPAKMPWLRLDRVLIGPGLAASSFSVLPRHVSAHRPIVAEIGRAPPR